MMSSGPQPSTSTSSAGYNNILRGIARDSSSLHSANGGSQKMGTAHAYQLQNAQKGHIQGADGSINNSLTVNGVNEKLLYKNGQQMRATLDNSSNGYLIKSA